MQVDEGRANIDETECRWTPAPSTLSGQVARGDGDSAFTGTIVDVTTTIDQGKFKP